MITVVDILDEVETDVSALNGEIVRRAFHGHCCNFLANQGMFELMLPDYIRFRRAICRLNANVDRHPWRANHHEGKESDYRILQSYMERANIVRKCLKDIWPCVACIWLYNPTGKTNFPQLIC